MGRRGFSRGKGGGRELVSCSLKLTTLFLRHGLGSVRAVRQSTIVTVREKFEV